MHLGNSLIVGFFLDHKSVVGVAPNWDLYKYKTLDVGGNEEYKKCFGAAPSWGLPELPSRKPHGEGNFSRGFQPRERPQQC